MAYMPPMEESSYPMFRPYRMVPSSYVDEVFSPVVDDLDYDAHEWRVQASSLAHRYGYPAVHPAPEPRRRPRFAYAYDDPYDTAPVSNFPCSYTDREIFPTPIRDTQRNVLSKSHYKDPATSSKSYVGAASDLSDEFERPGRRERPKSAYGSTSFSSSAATSSSALASTDKREAKSSATTVSTSSTATRRAPARSSYEDNRVMSNISFLSHYRRMPRRNTEKGVDFSTKTSRMARRNSARERMNEKIAAKMPERLLADRKAKREEEAAKAAEEAANAPAETEAAAPAAEVAAPAAEGEAAAEAAPEPEEPVKEVKKKKKKKKVVDEDDELAEMAAELAAAEAAAAELAALELAELELAAAELAVAEPAAESSEPAAEPAAEEPQPEDEPVNA